MASKKQERKRKTLTPRKPSQTPTESVGLKKVNPATEEGKTDAN